MDLSTINKADQWSELYQKLVYWEMELDEIDNSGMMEILESQKQEANTQFCKFIEHNYSD